MVAINERLTTVIAPTPNEEKPSGSVHVYDFRGVDLIRLRGTVRHATRINEPGVAPTGPNVVELDYLQPSEGWARTTDTSNLVMVCDAHNLAKDAPQIEFFADQYVASPHQFTSAGQVKVDGLAQRILRKHFLTEIAAQLSNLEEHAQNEHAADYANKLFRCMRQVRDRLATDPFSAVVLALHDALAFDNNWIRYEAQQYKNAREILIRFGNQDLHEDKALKAIAALEGLGFDTTPFNTPDEDSAPE